MNDSAEFNRQFELNQNYYLHQLDFLNWYRYYYIIKEITNNMPDAILEVGSGSGILRNCLKPLISNFTVLDINSSLHPDIVGDVRICIDELKNKFDYVVVADVFEHIPFCDLEKCLTHIDLYLKQNGKAILTIPHRRSNFLFMTPAYRPHVFTVPTGFLSFGAFYRRFIKRKIWIDPYHCWEIGDGKVKKKDVEAAFLKAGFVIERFQKLLYVDFWVLRKP